LAVARWASQPVKLPGTRRDRGNPHVLTAVLRTPGVLLMGFTNAALIAIQTGVLVFLFPLYLANRGHIGPQTVGILVSLGVGGRLLALWIGGNVSDRWGRIRVLVPGLVAYAALLGSVAFVTNVIALGAWSLALGATAGLVAALPTALVGDQVAGSLQGVAI